MKGNGETLHQNLHYLGVPLKVNMYLSKSDRFSFYVGAGLLFERCVYGTVAVQKGFVIRTLHSEEPFGITLSGGERILF